MKEENRKDGLVVGPHHSMTSSFKIHFPLSVHRTTTDAKTSFKCAPSFVYLSILCILYFYLFNFCIFLYLYIATLLTPFLRSAQMNSKSSKSVLCCGPCQSISILRIVCRLSFSFIFSNAQQLHSLFTLYDYLLPFFLNDSEEQMTMSVDISRSE